MKRTTAALALALASAAALAACGPPSPTTDASDVVQPDVIITPDAADVRGDTPDGGSLVCNTLPVENLNTLGTQAGDTTTLTSDNNMAPANPALGVQVPGALQTNGACAFKIGHQRVFSYTAHTNSVLRVSTTNPGTSPAFDTVVVILPNTQCPRTLRQILGCNDDDPAFTLDQRHISSTSVAIAPVMANATVLIALGGFVPVMGARNEAREMGNFELTVQELTAVAADGVCDRRRLTNACGDGLTCVSDAWPSDAGHCRANGSVAGAECDSSGACSGAGLTCDTNSGICLAQVTTAGTACDPYHQCDTGLSCVTIEAGSSTGSCVADGSASGASCTAAGTCVTGLICSTINGQQFCQVAGTMNGPCNTWDGACPGMQDCVAPTASGREGTCTDTATTPGTHCTTTCAAAMSSCEMGASFNVCQHDAAAGQPCGVFDTCGTTASCRLTDLNDVYNGICRANGALGGPCNMTAPFCAGTAVCSDMTDPANGSCINAVADGAACSITDQCGMTSSCVQDVTPVTRTFAGHCRPAGTVAGAECRSTGMPCDTGLTCSSWIPEEGVCQSAGTAGGACMPRNASVRCPTGQVCRSSSILAGTCAAPQAEGTAQNDVPVATLPVTTTPVAIAGSLASFDIDCFQISVPAGQGVYAAATAPSGACGGSEAQAQLQISVYKLMGTSLRLLGEDTGSGTFRCPRIDAHDAEFAWARNTTAAAMPLFVCVHNNGTSREPISAYVLSLETHP